MKDLQKLRPRARGQRPSDRSRGHANARIAARAHGGAQWRESEDSYVSGIGRSGTALRRSRDHHVVIGVGGQRLAAPMAGVGTVRPLGIDQGNDGPVVRLVDADQASTGKNPSAEATKEAHGESD